MTNKEAIEFGNMWLEINEDCKDSSTYTFFQMAIKALEQTRWISVSERLPASDEDVLVTNGIVTHVGWIDATDKCWRVDFESEYFMNDIVAWMPLPPCYESPESENKE